VATNITPLLTIGGASCPRSSPVEKDQTGFSFATLAAVICFSGL
jgi:hypothetical protein